MLCEDIEYQIQNEFNSGKVYEALGDVQGESSCERLLFRTSIWGHGACEWESNIRGNGFRTYKKNAWYVIKEVNGLRLYNIYYLCKTAKRSIDEITFLILMVQENLK